MEATAFAGRFKRVYELLLRWLKHADKPLRRLKMAISCGAPQCIAAYMGRVMVARNFKRVNNPLRHHNVPSAQT